MRNFEADKLVRIGDVMDFLEKYTRGVWDGYEIDLGDVASELLKIAERRSNA